MPAVGFRCPDGATVKFGACTSCNHRCMSLPALKSAEDSTHHWFGRPSVTTLIKPTRMTYLEMTTDYYIDPLGGIAAMIGTVSHKAFEDHSPDGWMAEHRMTDDITSGCFDAYDKTTHTLWDWKFFRARRIAMALGMQRSFTVRTVTRGKYKGEHRPKEVWSPGGVRQVMDIAKQLNYYRYMMENEGIPVDSIKVNMFLRSSVDAEAKAMGLTKPAYIVPINFISKHWIRRFFKAKYDRLMHALESKELPPPCKKTERWSNGKTYPNRRCADWCSVNENCEFYQTHHCGNVHKDMPDE